jgi:hypothetical protein
MDDVSISGIMKSIDLPLLGHEMQRGGWRNLNLKVIHRFNLYWSDNGLRDKSIGRRIAGWLLVYSPSIIF